MRVVRVGPSTTARTETVALYTDVHRGVEWPGLPDPELVRYGPGVEETFEVYRPEQGFSEPGPVFLFLHGNGLGKGDRIAPGSDGLIYSHLGKLSVLAGGIGVAMNYRVPAGESGSGDGTAATLEACTEGLRRVIEWLSENISSYGGDRGTIVILANSEGATTTAAYLFNKDWQTESGPKVAAAILASGLFGSLAPEIERLVFDYEGERVPLALWTAQYDTAEVTAGIADLHEILCRKYQGCPWTDHLEGHNHVSHIMSLGTADTSALNSFIRFYHTVRYSSQTVSRSYRRGEVDIRSRASSSACSRTGARGARTTHPRRRSGRGHRRRRSCSDSQ